MIATQSPAPKASSSPYVIEIDNVRHAFRDDRTGSVVEAVADANIQVKAGEFVSLVGPSGCGKTTLLNIISGLTKPTRGAARLHGALISGVQPRVIGYMFARDTLLPWRTVAENVRLGLEFNRASKQNERVDALLEMIGLTGFANSYPDQLSHGMRQRVALARTLAPSPEVLLMDEPFGALDAQTKLLMEEEFIRIWEANKKTVVFVTHDIVEALTLSDRVLVFTARPGRIKAEYTLDFPRPRQAEALQDDPRFLSLVREVWHHLKSENIRGRG